MTAMEFEGIPDHLLARPLSDFALPDDAAIDALHARARAGDPEAFDLMYLALVAHRCESGAQRTTTAIRSYRLKNGRRKGGVARAKKLKAQPAIPPWMIPIFDEAYERLAREAPAAIGRRTLSLIAQRVAGPDHIDHFRRNKLGERAADKYIKQRSTDR